MLVSERDLRGCEYAARGFLAFLGHGERAATKRIEWIVYCRAD